MSKPLTRENMEQIILKYGLGIRWLSGDDVDTPKSEEVLSHSGTLDKLMELVDAQENYIIGENENEHPESGIFVGGVEVTAESRNKLRSEQRSRKLKNQRDEMDNAMLDDC